MSLRRPAAASFAVIALLIGLYPAMKVTAALPSAHVPFVVSPDTKAEYPAVAVDDHRTGYFVLNSSGSPK
jgi:hypothetical protein